MENWTSAVLLWNWGFLKMRPHGIKTKQLSTGVSVSSQNMCAGSSGCYREAQMEERSYREEECVAVTDKPTKDHT